MVTTPRLKPTVEQQAIIDAYQAGKHLVIEAGAGTGKTSTLRLLAAATPGRQGVYIAYNRAIATDAKRTFPPEVHAATAHSLAFRAVGRRYADRLFNTPRMPARETARLLGITRPLLVGPGRTLTPAKVARLVTDTITRFCYSADPELTVWHVPARLPGLDDPAALAALRGAVLPLAQRAWADLIRPNSRLKFTHDHYLKLWQLSNPVLEAEYVLLDEAQDANPVVADIVTRQTHAQRILVGDSCQAIYGWRGAIDALRTFPADTRLALSQSFRFGPAVATEANKFLGLLDAPLRLRGHDPIPSRLASLERPEAVLCRSNAEAITQVMAATDQGRKAALVGGGGDIRRLAEAAITLKAGRGTDHPELLAFRTWAEVQEYVEQDTAGRDLKVAVNLIDTHGPEALIATIDALESDERTADVIVSTAHKAKGREWDTVRIAGDFHDPTADPGQGRDGQDDHETGRRAELMLAYVAVTRARKVLDRGGLAWVDRLTAPTTTPTSAPAAPPANANGRNGRPGGRVEVVSRSLPPAAYTRARRWLLRDRPTGRWYVAIRDDRECVVFPADRRGEVTDWGQVAGHRGATHQQAIDELERVLAAAGGGGR